MKNKNFIIVAFFILLSSLSNAQSHNEEVTVEGSYTPQIQKSERIIHTPEIPKREFNIPNYVVNTEDYFYNYIIDLEPISPLQYSNKKTHDITNNFIKAGIGTRLSPDFLFRHYSNISKNMSLGIGVTHNSTWLEMKDYPFLKYMNNDFSISMKNRFSGFQLHSYIKYNYDMYYLNPDLDIMTDDGYYSKRNIHALNIKLLANNNKTAYKSIYNEYLLDYSYSGIQGGIQENLAKFKAHVEHSNSWLRNSDGIQTLAVDINADIDNINQTLFLIAANPYIAFDGEYYNIHLGFRADAKTNTTNMGGIYPDVRGSLYLFERNFEFYAGLGGKTKINTLKEILSENPFIISDLKEFAEFDYEKTKLDFNGGLKFKVLDKLDGHIGIRYRNVDNHIFYVPSFENTGTFDVTIEDCSITNILADIQFRISDNIKIVADFKLNGYEKESNKDYVFIAYYKPKTEFRLRGFYKVNNRWNFNIATYIDGKRNTINKEGDLIESIVLKPICDIQLGCDYNMNENLSFYCEVKNLINNKYQMYYGYPSYGLQAFVGFKYRFL